MLNSNIPLSRFPVSPRHADLSRLSPPRRTTGGSATPEPEGKQRILPCVRGAGVGEKGGLEA